MLGVNWEREKYYTTIFVSLHVTYLRNNTTSFAICLTRYGNNTKSFAIWYLTKLDSLRYNMNSSYVSWFLVLYFIVTYPMVFDIRIRSVPWVRRFFASSVGAFTTPGGRISQVPTCTREYYTILCLLLYAIPRQLIVVYSSSPPPTCISNQTETYSFFESTTKAYPLYHWCDVLIWYCNTCILTSPITYVCCSI